MRVSDFKDICSMLGKFANARENAKSPEKYIFVQVKNGRLKLVAGTKEAVIVVDVQDAEGEFKYLIEARPFLQTAKALSARQEVDVLVLPDALVIKSEMGGSISLKPVGLEISEWGIPKPPKEFSAEIAVPSGVFDKISRLMTGIHGDANVNVPTIEVIEGKAFIAATHGMNNVSYALWNGTGEGEYHASAYPSFWEAIRFLDGEGVIRLGVQGVLVESGNVLCYSGPYKVSRYDPVTKMSQPPVDPDPWPILVFKGKPTASFTIDRRKLHDIAKGFARHDEHNRITISVDTDLVQINAYGSKEGMSLPLQSSGTGQRSMHADYLLGVIDSLTTKEITISWGDPSPAIRVSADGYSDWTILLAPTTK